MDLKKWIIRVSLTGLAILAAAYVLPGVSIDDYGAAWVAALLLSLLNAVVRPLLIILTLPITVFTLGLFLLVINGFMILLAAEWIEGFHVRSLAWAVVMSVVVSLFTFILEQISHRPSRNRRDE